MTIMDKINEMTVAAGGTPSGGSIMDCINNLTVATGGTPSGGSIADTVAAYKEAVSDAAAEEESSGSDPVSQDGNDTPSGSDPVSQDNTDDEQGNDDPEVIG